MRNKKAVKYLFDINPLYIYFKKHYCPYCTLRVTLLYRSLIVNSDSEDAKHYDFTVSDTKIKGDLEFRIPYFRCDRCKINISQEEMKNYEKARR